jgi:xylulokinase
VGLFDDFAVAARFGTQSTEHRPDFERHDRYGREYALFLDAYRRLEPWFDDL